VRVRAYLTACGVASVVLTVLAADLTPVAPQQRAWVTAGVLVLVSVLNVEISRALAGGLEQTHQPHKALSAWAFAAALLLPTPWLLVVVPLTYAHAHWRGLRLPLWKWVGSAVFLVLAGVAAAGTRHLVFGDEANWMTGNGGHGLAAMVSAAATFLAVETVLFAGVAILNTRADELWLRKTLTSASFYLTEAAVLVIGGLLAGLWTGGAWYVLLLLPIYALAQRAALHEPLRERAEAAALLADKNLELELANEFKIDLIGMLGHELGNPVTSILGYSEIGAEALADGDDELTRHSLQVIEDNAQVIRIVLHEILDTVSSGRAVLAAKPEKCLLEPHLRAAAAGQPSGRQPLVECPADLMALVQPNHLAQMVANLLHNAEKYAGGAVRLVAEAVGPGDVEIAVVDEGAGVPEAFRGRLFERFSRDSGTAETVLGTGLGLFITRELARANHGDVRYRAGNPSGSEFVVTLPAPDPDQR
jgi:signal transduction histidine kinase